MVKHIAVTLLLAGLAFPQHYTVLEHLDEVRKVRCLGEVPKDFACAVLFDVAPPFLDGIDIASVVGGVSNLAHSSAASMIREVSLILDGTLYTAVYDPPLKRDSTLSSLRRGVGISARVDGDDLFIKWPDGKEAKAKVIRREKINPNRVQPA
jgi:hypothetical protein